MHIQYWKESSQANYMKVTYIKNGQEITQTFGYSNKNDDTDFVIKVFDKDTFGVFVANVNGYYIKSVTAMRSDYVYFTAWELD